MNLRPLNDRILVRRLDTMHDSVIVAPDIAPRDGGRGRVVAVGPGKRDSHGGRISVDIKPGDVVRFGRFVDFERDDLVMIQEGDILVVEKRNE